ncbi:MAG: alpha/beta hydrolase [Alphaproteobacteria bacterium]|nr:MAG: alpha/beta hydrolase [Alphaproteobacteria bacterium]
MHDMQAVVAENRGHSACRFAFLPDGRGIPLRGEVRFRIAGERGYKSLATAAPEGARDGQRRCRTVEGGRPILALHGFDTIDPEAAFLELLGRHGEIVAPSSPGFGGSSRPKDFDTVYDLMHLYLELLEMLPGDKVTLLGFSFGGWLAAEVAAACSHRLDKLVLVDPVGIKISDRETPDILDIFNRSPDEVRRRSWHDPDRFAPDYDAMSDEALIVRARNREALCLYAWHPYLYNPQLPRWLAAIRVPTLLLWGASDGLVTPDYGRAYSRLIPGSRFEMIEAAGHHPEIEQPVAFVERVAAFIEE